MKTTFYILPLLLLLACSEKKPSEQTISSSEAPVHDLAKAQDSWIESRVNSAKERLNTTVAGRKLWETIEAHGGLSRWFANGPISFHFDYQPLDGGTRRNSYQTIDQWSVRAVHEVAADRTMKYGWDGAQAWFFPDTADVGVNPRFWSTTPFYFVGLPFVLADEGVILEEMEPTEYKGVTYELLRASYEDGVGDAPDDFYVIYIHPKTRKMGALRYIVSYPGFFPDGGHLPEKFMEILGHEKVNGMTVPTGFNTHWFKDGEVAEHITKIDVTEYSFQPGLERSYFQMPAGAKIQEGL